MSNGSKSKEGSINVLYYDCRHDSLRVRGDGGVVSSCATHVVGLGFVLWLGHTKDHDKNDTKLPPC